MSTVSAVKLKLWISLAAVLVVVAAVSAVAVFRARLPEYLISGHKCTDTEARFAEALSRDPLLTQPPAGVPPIAVQPIPEPFQPCEGNGDNSYYGGAHRGYELPKTTQGLAEVEAYYIDLARANAWRVSKPGAGQVVGQKMIDGTAVVFHLYGLEHKPHYTAYWVELRYAEIGSARYLLTMEDTFR